MEEIKVSKFNRRTFNRLLSGSAAGIYAGLSGSAWVSAGEAAKAASAGTKFVSRKYQTFQPGVYLDWEKKMIEERLEQAKNPGRVRQGPGGEGQQEGKTPVTEAEILKYNSTWDPYNPLFNNKEYAKKAGYPGIPAFPCFQTPRGNAPSAIPMDFADKWYYANDGSDVKVWTHVFAGDLFTSQPEKSEFTELTVPGSDLRMFILGASAKMFNAKGEQIGWGYGNTREAYRKIIDGSPKPSFTENMTEWCEYFPAAHYTTDEEYEYIKELWAKEKIRGSEKLYWDDVKVGDEPTWTCTGPVSYMDLNNWHGSSGTNLRGSKENPKNMFRDRYGIYMNIAAIHHGSRNITNSRAVFYNHTAALHMARMVTNYIGDAGLVTRVCWRFKQLFKEMQLEKFQGGDILDKVPYMKGKMCTVHPSEGDTIIAKGYVTDKYINDRGEHTIDISAWAETLDDRIIEAVAFSAKLPTRKG
jgi:hypothetical protein